MTNKLTTQSLINYYLEYLNQWLTITRMAEYYEMPYNDCEYLVQLGKKYHEQNVEFKNQQKQNYAVEHNIKLS